MVEKIEEEWRDVIGYEGYYQVSNIGRAKSLDRYVLYKKCRLRDEHIRLVKGKILSGKCFEYVAIVLCKGDGSYKNAMVHRLIAQAFVHNPDPENKTQVNHINGLKHDNREVNLEWVTPLENTTHAWRTGLNNTRIGKGNHESQPILDTYTGISYECVSDAFKAQSKYKHHKSMIRAIQRGYIDRYVLLAK